MTVCGTGAEPCGFILHGEGPAARDACRAPRAGPYADTLTLRAWYTCQMRRHSGEETEAAAACWRR